MGSELKPQAALGEIRARELMDFHNSAWSDKSDKLVAILEAGEWSSLARDQLDQWLNNYLVTANKMSDTLSSLGYNRTKLRQCLSIKEKIAYTTGLVYAHKGIGPDPSHPIVDIASKEELDKDRIESTLDKTIKDIEEWVINNKDFSESRILRNAAVNRFECNLSPIEIQWLDRLAIKMRDLCKANHLDNLVESTNWTNESSAQKIMKLSTVMIELSANNIPTDAQLIKEFETFDKKIEPLRTLDKHYKHVTKALNMMHRLAQKGYHSMIRRKQVDQLNSVIQKLGMTKIVNDRLADFNKLENFDKNEEHGFLEKLLEEIKEKTEFKQTIYSMSITEAQFNAWFFSYSCYTVMNKAKADLHHQKGITFGNKLKDFEADTSSRRGMMRRKILDIGERMEDNGGILNDTDFDTANSYFNKFPDLFFAKEEDNYSSTLNNNRSDKLHYDKMEMVLSAIIRKRVGPSAAGHKIRRWSAWRIFYKFIENGLKGKERGLYQHMRRIRHKADDATIIAMVIMAQNSATNQVFYQDKDRTKKADSRRGKLWGKVSFAENGRKAVSDRVSPKAKKICAFTEEAAIKTAQLGKLTAKGLNKAGSKIGRAATYTIGAGLGTYNDTVKKWWYKRYNPLHLPYLLTAPTERVMKKWYKWATYMDRKGNEHIDTVGKAVGQWYDEAKKLVGKATGKETEYLLDWVRTAIDATTSIAGQGLAGVGQWMHDSYTVGQQRTILDAFYDAAKEEDWLADLMASAELGEILNLKNRWPYLFDNDGRIVTTERAKERYTEDKTGETNVKKDILSKKYEEIDGQYKEFMKELEKKFNEAEARENNTTIGTKERTEAEAVSDNILTRLSARTEAKGSMNELLLIIQQFAVGTITDTAEFHKQVTASVKKMGDKVIEWETMVDNNSVPLWFKQQIAEKDRDIEKNKVEIKKLDDKLGKSINDWDQSTEIMKKDCESIEKDIRERITTKTSKWTELSNKKGALEEAKISKSRLDEYINNPSSGLKKKVNGLTEQKATWITRKNEVKALEKDLIQAIADGKTNADQNVIRKEIAQKKLKRDELSENLWNATDTDGIDIFIKGKNDELLANEQELWKVIGNIATLNDNIEKLNAAIADEDEIINKNKTRKEELYSRIKAKWPDDESRVNTNSQKMRLEQEIIVSEMAKADLTKKMVKQDEQNKVYRQLHRRWQKVQTLSGKIAAGYDNTMEEKDKAKLFIQTIKGAEIDFYVKPEVTAKTTVSSLDKEEKKELVDALA